EPRCFEVRVATLHGLCESVSEPDTCIALKDEEPPGLRVMVVRRMDARRQHLLDELPRRCIRTHLAPAASGLDDFEHLHERYPLNTPDIRSGPSNLNLRGALGLGGLL